MQNKCSEPKKNHESAQGPGLVEGGGDQIRGDLRFIAINKHPKKVSMRRACFFPVMAVKRHAAIDGKKKHFTQIYRESEAVSAAYQQLSSGVIGKGMARDACKKEAEGEIKRIKEKMRELGCKRSEALGSDRSAPSCSHSSSKPFLLVVAPLNSRNAHQSVAADKSHEFRAAPPRTPRSELYATNTRYCRVYRTLPGLDEELNVYVQYGDDGNQWGVYEGSEAVKDLMEFMDPGSVRERQVMNSDAFSETSILQPGGCH